MLERIKHVFALIWKLQAAKWKLRQATKAYRKTHNRAYYVKENRHLKSALNHAAIFVYELIGECPADYSQHQSINEEIAGCTCTNCKATKCKVPILCWYEYFKCCGDYAKIEEVNSEEGVRANG